MLGCGSVIKEVEDLSYSLKSEYGKVGVRVNTMVLGRGPKDADDKASALKLLQEVEKRAQDANYYAKTLKGAIAGADAFVRDLKQKFPKAEVTWQ